MPTVADISTLTQKIQAVVQPGRRTRHAGTLPCFDGHWRTNDPGFMVLLSSCGMSAANAPKHYRLGRVVKKWRLQIFPTGAHCLLT